MAIALKKGLPKPVLIGGIIIGLIVVLKVTGVLQFSGSISKQESGEATKVVKMEKYENQAFSFRVDYPSEWEVKENPTPDTVVGFYSPKDKTRDVYFENLTIRVVDLSVQPGVSLAQAADLWVQQTETESVGGGFVVTNREQGVLAGQEAAVVVYDMQIEDMKGKGRTVITLIDDIAYITSYYAEASSYQEYLGDINKILDSFEVIQ